MSAKGKKCFDLLLDSPKYFFLRKCMETSIKNLPEDPGKSCIMILRACLHGVGHPGLVGLVSFVFTLLGTGTQNKRNLPH